MGVKQPKGNPYEREYRRGHDRGYAKGIAAENKRLMEEVCMACGSPVICSCKMWPWSTALAPRRSRAEYERRSLKRDLPPDEDVALRGEWTAKDTSAG